MVELDDNILTPDEMREWLDQEVRDLTKSVQLRMQEATEFVISYAVGKITPKEAMDRLARYDARWGGDSGEAERLFRKEAERHSGMIPNTIGA